MPGAPASLHVEKMIVKALVAGRVGFGALRAVPEKAQRHQRAFYRRGARHKSTLDSHRVRCQREAGGSNTGRPTCFGLVDHQPVGWIRLMQEVVERFVLKLLQFGVES